MHAESDLVDVPAMRTASKISTTSSKTPLQAAVVLAVTAAHAITDRIMRNSGSAVASAVATPQQQQTQLVASRQVPRDPRLLQAAARLRSVQPAVPATQAPAVK